MLAPRKEIKYYIRKINKQEKVKNTGKKRNCNNIYRVTAFSLRQVCKLWQLCVTCNFGVHWNNALVLVS